jgi:hypothetical protein
MYETRPYTNYSEERRVNNLSAGAIHGQETRVETVGEIEGKRAWWFVGDIVGREFS